MKVRYLLALMAISGSVYCKSYKLTIKNNTNQTHRVFIGQFIPSGYGYSYLVEGFDIKPKSNQQEIFKSGKRYTVNLKYNKNNDAKTIREDTTVNIVYKGWNTVLEWQD